MSDIQAGDVVQWDGTPCHRCDTPDNSCANLSAARPYRVERVDFDPSYSCPGIWLAGCGDGSGDGICIRGFHKLNDEPEDAALIAKIKRCKPIRQPLRETV